MLVAICTTRSYSIVCDSRETAYHSLLVQQGYRICTLLELIEIDALIDGRGRLSDDLT